MTPTTPEQAAHLRRLRLLIAWVIPTALGFAALETAAWANFRDAESGVTAALLLAYGAWLTVPWLQLRRGRLVSAVLTFCAGTLLLVLGIAAVQPFAGLQIAVVPLLVAAVALPYITGATLRRLMLVCWLVTLEAAVTGRLVSTPSRTPPWFDNVVQVVGLGAIAGLVLLLLWQFASRLRETLAQREEANAALVAALDRLAAENARTAFQADLLDQVEVAVAATDMDGRIVHWNRAAERLYGWSREEMLGRVARGVIVPLNRQEEALAIRDAVAAGRSWQGEFELQRKDGSAFPALLFVSGVRDGPGRTVGMLGAVIDLAERKRADETLLHAQKMAGLEALAAGIAHDFNNLLTTIMGNAALLRADLPAGSSAAEGAAEIEVASRRAAELTEQMLTFAGKGTRVRERLELARLVREMDHLLGVATRDRATPRYRLDEATPPIEGDSDQLRQVVLGLVLNAVEATPASGTITVSTGSMDADRAYLEASVPGGGLAAGRYAYLEVGDTGHGMDEETRRRIFDPFFSTRFAGRGLGLSAVLGIVHAHGGTIAVESAPGRGTTFRLLFPVVAELPDPTRAGGSGDERP